MYKITKKTMLALNSEFNWEQKVNINGAIKQLILFKSYLDRIGIVDNMIPTLYFSYKVDKKSNHQEQFFSKTLTEILEHLLQNENNISKIERKMFNICLRLLYGAIKTHYFLGERTSTSSQPRVYCVPDISKPGSFLYQLSYTLDDDTIIIISQWRSENVGSIQSIFKDANEFPVIVTDKSLQNISYGWIELKQKAQQYHTTFKKNIYSNILSEVDDWDDEDSFPFGTVLPDSIDSIWYRYLGAKYAKGIKKYYMEYGWDISSLKEWISYIKTAEKKELPNPNLINWLN